MLDASHTRLRVTIIHPRDAGRDRRCERSCTPRSFRQHNPDHADRRPHTGYRNAARCVPSHRSSAARPRSRALTLATSSWRIVSAELGVSEHARHTAMVRSLWRRSKRPLDAREPYAFVTTGNITGSPQRFLNSAALLVSRRLRVRGFLSFLRGRSTTGNKDRPGEQK